MFDTHTHCKHSHDSKEEPRNIIERAISLDMDYVAITDHYDGELTLLPQFDYIPQLDLKNHFEELQALKDEYKTKIQMGVGIECGYMKEADGIYLKALNKYESDMIINSVHTVEYEDCYLPSYFEKRTKSQAYGAYLKAVRESLDCPYAYDSIGHIGYITRKSIYEDKTLYYNDFADLLDDILKTLIVKGKSLEVNSNGGKLLDFLPTKEILKRYKELGGELVTFGSDAHIAARLGEKYYLVADFLKSIGINYAFKYLAHKPIAVKL